MAFTLTKQKFTRRASWIGAVVGSDSTDDDAAAAAAQAEAARVEAEAAAAKAEADKLKGDKTLSDKEAELLKEVMKHKAKAKETETALNALKESYTKFEGIDIDEVKELLANKKTADQKKLEDKGEWETLKKSMAEENAKLVKVELDKNAEFAAKLKAQQAKIDKLTLGNQFSTSPFILNDLNLSSEKTRIIYGSHFEFDGEKVIAFDKPKGSEGRAQLVDASGEPLSFEDSIKKIIDGDPDKERLIKSKQKSGAGSGTLGVKTTLNNPPELKGVDRIAQALNASK